ncbi:hypothetical protein CDD81_6709 [Ophiocordyceps australis]|uniref:Uncharacterized protein n=1 Tax=Ophiocordyceps australis TaxID=1399860 RepID=A0A2C5Y2B3_9HYPO|nr:hypothetical protein CDD81_6709 [Ophiocordyceps australis]
MGFLARLVRAKSSKSSSKTKSKKNVPRRGLIFGATPTVAKTTPPITRSVSNKRKKSVPQTVLAHAWKSIQETTRRLANMKFGQKKMDAKIWLAEERYRCRYLDQDFMMDEADEEDGDWDFMEEEDVDDDDILDSYNPRDLNGRFGRGQLANPRQCE